jgi:ABC-type glycerol-3-phosphate transport system substrate-binding protein
MRRVLLALLAALLAFGVLAVATEQVAITFLHAMKPTHAEIIEELVAKFAKEYPYIAVTLEYGGNYSDVEQKINAAIVAGNPPTVTQLYENAITPIVDVLVPIEDHLSSLEFNDIVPGLRGSATVNGTMYSVPWNKSIMILYYRKDLIDAPPTTWQEFYDLAQQLTVDLNGDGNPDRWGTVLRPKNPENFLNHLHQVGGTLLNEDWTEVTVNDALGLQAMEYIESLIPYSVVGVEYESDFLSADQTCMYVSTSAGAQYNIDAGATIGAEVGMALAPVGPAQGGTMVQGTNLVVLKDGQTQAQIEAGILFVKFMMRADNLAYWSVQSNYLPATYSSYQHETWTSAVAADPSKQVMADAMAVGFGPLNHPAYSDFRYHMITRYEEVLLGASTPQQALDDLAMDFAQYLE